MRTFITLIAMAVMFSTAADARGYNYGGGRHTSSHGGYYSGSSGSSHRGGTYHGPHGGYGRHK